MKFKFLDWDSKFFGKRIYRIDLSDPLTQEGEGLLENMEADLFYVVTNDPKYVLTDFFLKHGAILYDKKVTYSKTSFSEDYNSSVDLILDTPKDLTSTLEQIVYQSGMFSRFNLDPGLSNKFKSLYKIWIEKSLSSEIADTVYVLKNKLNVEVGFVTLTNKDGIGNIGLIAVDEKHRGKKIGQILVLLADRWFVENAVKEATVVTQLDNVPACNLYEKMGYQVSRIEYIYHLWKK